MADLLRVLFLQVAPIVMSVVALYVSLRDRWPKLLLRARKGEWYLLSAATTVTGKNVRFAGVVEIYNTSARANAIRGYQFSCKREGKWEPMESERFQEIQEGKPEQIFNGTPATIAPYSGIELPVAAFTSMTPMPNAMDVRVQVEDLFGKRYHVDLKANR